MELEELMAAIDLDSPAEFEYFEHFADLAELEAFIDYSDFYAILSEAPSYVLEELSQNYFEDMLANLPDDIIDIYTLLVSIQKCLTGLAAGVDTPEGRRAYVDEFYKFHCWYVEEGTVTCNDLTNDRICDISICEAIAHCRMEKLGEGTYSYDFSRCMDYQLDTYAVSVAKIASYAPEYDDEDETEDEDHSYAHRHTCSDDCGCGNFSHEHPDNMEEAYTTGLVDRSNPVIDGEYSDEEDNDPIL